MAGAVASELPTVLTTAELCERWRCTARTLERMARDGRIRRMKLRGGVRYPVDEVLRIERGEDRTVSAPPPSEAVRVLTGSAVAEMPVAAQRGPDRTATVDRTDSVPVASAVLRPKTVQEVAEPLRAPSSASAASAQAGTSTAAAVRRGRTSASTPAARDVEGTAATLNVPVVDEHADRRPALPPVPQHSWYTICVAHRKGGVAKSTTTWFVARELARAGKRVVLRDLDPQQGLRDILRDHGCEDGRYSKNIALVTDGEPLPFAPDVELIDTPPALDDSLPGVARADVVIVPAMPEHQAVRALERMLLVLEQTRHEHPFTRVLGLLPVRVKPRWTEHRAFLQQITALGERFGHPVLPSIPESRAVLTYSLRGRLWRPVAEAALADLERRQRAAAPVNGAPAGGG